MAPLFRHHDPGQVEVFCYSGVAQPDALTAEFRRHSAAWRETSALSDDALAEAIRRDGIDILVDLAQHLAANRLPVFAREPAPTQVSFAGYPESTGLEAIRYLNMDHLKEHKKQTMRRAA